MTGQEEALPIPIAHRGHAARWPENTMPALESAVALGCRHLEFDVQLTADLVPVMLHDGDLQRVAGRPGCVHDLEWRELAGIAVGEPARFGMAHAGVRPTSLEGVVARLADWPDVTAFVEVKRASLRRFGHDTVVARVARALQPALSSCVPISFDLDCAVSLRERTGARIGWVVERLDEQTLRAAEAARPEFLFVDLEQLPPAGTPLWPGDWRWAVYEITSLDAARRCARQGAHYVETMAIGDLLAAYAEAGAT